MPVCARALSARSADCARVFSRDCFFSNGRSMSKVQAFMLPVRNLLICRLWMMNTGDEWRCYGDREPIAVYRLLFSRS